ncbi:MAG: glycosyltransferase 87 family protein [Chlorobi bacterium]|nr:glycosyltransferase 87 family protein [Chlorobiota bacterium]MCI0714919.1 glycosyltransferase 87 family protein [Chlorobiota bacterium]
MSKRKAVENTLKKDASVINLPFIESEFEKKYSRYYWLIIPVLTVLFYSYRVISSGFYQDDEVAQYINMLNFWQDPWVILGNGPKPGYKIFMVLPSLLSYGAVLIVNSIIAATTVYLTYVLIKTYNVNNAFFGALLLASQPLYVNLSFRSYSEIFTALCIVIFLILYRKEKYFLCALVLGYIFTIRQEVALLILVFAYIFIKDKKYSSAAAMFIFPIIYNILGYVKTGDLFFVITEMKNVAGLNYKSQGLLHYFKVYIFIVGPICLSLFLLGFFGFLNDTSKFKDYIKKYGVFYLVFASIFIIQMLTMINDGPNPGNWRYLLHISPITAFFAAVGLNNLSLERFKNTNYLITGSFAVLVLLFLSKQTDGFILLENSDYTKLVFVSMFLVLSIVLWNHSKAKYTGTLGSILVILAIAHLYFVEPKKLSPENIAVKQTAEYIDSLPELKDKEKLANHPFVFFYSKTYKENLNSFKKLDLKNLTLSSKGSIVIWESHYGYRPEFLNDVKLELLQDTAKYKLMKQFVSADKRFVSIVFEKL